jgi:hypothetical protein
VAPVRPASPLLRGALRLDRPSPSAERQPLASPERIAIEPYYTSLAKLFPVEAVALYPLAAGIAGEDRSVRLILIAVIGMFVVALRWFGTQDNGGQPDPLAIAVALASFLLYAASLGGFGYLPGGPEQTRQLLAFITIIWVALAPLALRRPRR